MVCRLCLTKSESSLAIFSEDRIPKYIAKYLQMEITPDDPVSNVVCSLCWTHLHGFQIFHLRVKNAQKTLVTVCEELKSEGHHTASDVSENMDMETIMKLIKEEDIDETFDNSDTSLKVKVSNPEKYDIIEATATTSAKANEPLPNQIFTKVKNYPRQAPSANKSPSNIKATTKCGQGKKKQIGEHPKPGTSDEGILNVNSKRKRGRPKAREKKTKVERSRKILQTTKEFDNIIEKNMDLKCEICSAKLTDFAELLRHFRTIHNRPGYALCCNKRLYKRGLVVDHIKTHQNPDHFKCTECGKVLADRICLRVHELLTHQNEEDKMFQCPHCPKKFAKQYLIHHHRVKLIPQTKRTFTCSECGRGFPTQITLTKHFNNVHSTIYHKKCEICAKLIRGKAAFERHKEEHKGIVRPRVQCGICGTLLKDKHILRKHMMNKHDGKSHSCDVCGKSSASKTALQSHLRHMHQNVRDFQCTFCDKSFKKAVNLREHLTTHTKEVLYTCPHCPKTFSFNSNMHAHRKKEHREEWEANRRSVVKKAPSTETSLALT